MHQLITLEPGCKVQLSDTNLNNAMLEARLIWSLVQSSTALKAPLFMRTACCSWARQSWRCSFILSCTVYARNHTQTAYCSSTIESSQGGLPTGFCQDGEGHEGSHAHVLWELSIVLGDMYDPYISLSFCQSIKIIFLSRSDEFKTCTTKYWLHLTG